MIKKVIPKMPVTPLGKMPVVSKEVKPMPMTPSMKKPIVPLDKPLMGGASKPRVVTPMAGGVNKPTPNKSTPIKPLVRDNPSMSLDQQRMKKEYSRSRIFDQAIPKQPDMTRRAAVEPTRSIMPVTKTIDNAAQSYINKRSKL